MKIAPLLMLLSATVCWAQNFQWSFSGPTTQRDLSPPYALVNGKAKRGPNPLTEWQRDQSLNTFRYGSEVEEMPPLFSDGNSLANLKPSMEQRENPPDKEVEWRSRFRGQPDTARFLNSAFFPVFFTSSTVTVTVSVTSAVVSTCIPGSQFIASSTNPCARRRRRGIEYEESFADAEPLDIAPTQVERMTTTTLPVLEEIDISRGEIMSSQDDTAEEIAENQLTPASRRARQIRFTTTTTSYIFTSTVIKKTVNLITGSSQLNCLPSPYIVC